MRVDFTKMHGLGNDFVVLDARTHALPAMTNAAAKAIASCVDEPSPERIIPDVFNPHVAERVSRAVFELARLQSPIPS